jgi:hypothetical protein
MFYILFCMHKAIFTFVAWKNFVIFLTSLALYLKVAHLIFGVQNLCVYIVYVGGLFFIWMMLY